MQNVAIKAVVTPLLIGGASLAGRRWGDHMGGWLVALPLTSGPVAFFLATEHGADFAAVAATGMMAGTISQVACALAYRAVAQHGIVAALPVGILGFAASTLALSHVHWSALPMFVLVLASVVTGFLLTRRTASPATYAQAKPPRWDIPVRMIVATAVTFGVTAAAPIIGPHLAGLLSPLPVFGIVLAVFSHRTHGPAAAIGVLEGLVLGLLAPAAFFLVLALTLPAIGLVAFGLASAVALTAQATTLALPRVSPPRQAGPSYHTQVQMCRCPLWSVTRQELIAGPRLLSTSDAEIQQEC